MQTATEALCSHKAARHIALHLLAPSAKRYLPAHAAAMLRPAASVAPTGKAGAEAAPRHSKAAAGSSDDNEDIVVGAAPPPVSVYLSRSGQHAMRNFCLHMVFGLGNGESGRAESTVQPKTQGL